MSKCYIALYKKNNEDCQVLLSSLTYDQAYEEAKNNLILQVENMVFDILYVYDNTEELYEGIAIFRPMNDLIYNWIKSSDTHYND